MTNPADGKSPVTLHPAFPAIVALWFAALLGLGSMVLPVTLLETFVTTTGLAAIIPGAEPPLGFTARGLIALVAAVSGAGVGLVLARRVAASYQPRGGNRLSRIGGANATVAPRPISAHDELGQVGLAVAGTRRRALSVTDEARTSDFLAHAPMPGAGAPAEQELAYFSQELARERDMDPPSVFAAPSFDPQPSEAAAMEIDSDAFDVLDLSEDHEPAAEYPAYPAEQPRPATIIEDPIESVNMDDHQVVQHSSTTPPLAPVAAPDGEAISGEAIPGEPITDHMGLPNLVEQLGRSMVRRRQAIAQAAVVHQPAPVPVVATVAVPDHGAAPAAPFANPDLHVARPEEAAQAMAAYFGKPAAIGAARDQSTPGPTDTSVNAERPAEQELAITDEPAPQFSAQPAPAAGFAPFLPVADEEGDDLEDVTASFSLPRHSFSHFNSAAEPTASVPDVADTDDDADAEDEPFGSLLSLNNPFIARSSGFVRVDDADEDEEPIAGQVVFPGQDSGHGQAHAPVAVQPAPAVAAARLFDRPGTSPATARAAPGDMDDALRSALAKLQRMSGAA